MHRLHQFNCRLKVGVMVYLLFEYKHGPLLKWAVLQFDILVSRAVRKQVEGGH